MTGAAPRMAWMERLLASDLSDRAKVVGTRLALHHNDKTGRCDPSLDRLVAGVSKARSGVHAALVELAEGGWIEIESRGREGGGRGTNVYRLRFTDRVSEQAAEEGPNVREVGPLPDEQTSDFEGAKVREVGPLNVREVGPEPRIYNQEGEPKGFPPTPHDSADPPGSPSPNTDDEGFTDFWQHCPRKVEEAAARRQYLHIVRKGIATPGELLAGIIRYAAAVEGREARYIKHPTRWLKAGCWTDEPELPPKAAGGRQRTSLSEIAWQHIGDS